MESLKEGIYHTGLEWKETTELPGEQDMRKKKRRKLQKGTLLLLAFQALVRGWACRDALDGFTACLAGKRKEKLQASFTQRKRQQGLLKFLLKQVFIFL